MHVVINGFHCNVWYLRLKVVKEGISDGKIFCSNVYIKFFEVIIQDFKSIFYDSYKRTLSQVVLTGFLHCF